MRARWLGWAGVELEAEDQTLVIDPLSDPDALYAWLGDRASDAELPEVAPPISQASAVAGLVSHLHRDHTDAGALRDAVAPGGPLLGPPAETGGQRENLGLAQARAELSTAGLVLEAVEPWTTKQLGSFEVTALPAADGSGDPQVSWLVEAQGRRVLHLGDTLYHGFWWRMAQRHGPFDVVFAPVNGAVIDFPHRQPPSSLPAVMEPEQAAIAADALGASTVVPMHYGGFALAPYYRPISDASDRFAVASAGRGYEARALAPGEELELANG